MCVCVCVCLCVCVFGEREGDKSTQNSLSQLQITKLRESTMYMLTWNIILYTVCDRFIIVDLSGGNGMGRVGGGWDEKQLLFGECRCVCDILNSKQY